MNLKASSVNLIKNVIILFIFGIYLKISLKVKSNNQSENNHLHSDQYQEDETYQILTNPFQYQIQMSSQNYQNYNNNPSYQPLQIEYANQNYDYQLESFQQDCNMTNYFQTEQDNRNQHSQDQFRNDFKNQNYFEPNQCDVDNQEFKFQVDRLQSSGEFFKCLDFLAIKNYDKFQDQYQYLGALQTTLSTDLKKFDFINPNQVYQGKIQPGKILKISWQNYSSKKYLDFYELHEEMNTLVLHNNQYIGYIDHTYSFIWGYLLNNKIVNIYPYFFSKEGNKIHILLEVYINPKFLKAPFDQNNNQQYSFNKCIKYIDQVALKILLNILRLQITSPSLIERDLQKYFQKFNILRNQVFPKVLISCKKTFNYYKTQLQNFPNHFVDFYSQVNKEIEMLKSQKHFKQIHFTEPIQANINYPSKMQNIYYCKKQNQKDFIKNINNVVIISAEKSSQEDSIDNENSYRFYQQAQQPSDVVSNLHPYQLQGLQWLLYRERRVDNLYIPTMRNQLQDQKTKIDIDYEEIELVGGQKIYRNIINNKFQYEFPEQQDIFGGILADEMGLGKTLTIISLIHETKKERTSKYGTLIITPSNLVNQWENQFKNHSKADSISILNLQQKNNRSKSFEDYDVVICSYNIICMLFESYDLSDKIFNQQWERIILDEAQKIKNKQSKVSEACFEIQSKYKWCLTGTPLENSIDDIYSLIRFLNIPKYSDWNWWRQNVKNTKNQEQKSNSFKIINQIIENLTLRRTKKSQYANGESITSIPEKQIQNIYIDLFDNEKNIYDKIFQKTQQVYKFFKQNSNKKDKNYMHVFEVLTKLRRFCVHPSLTFKIEEEAIQVSENSTNDIISKINSFLNEIQSKIQQQNKNNKESNQNNDEKNQEPQNNISQYQKEVIQQIKDGQFQVCSVCLEDIKYHSISSCLHVFCSSCLEQSIQTNHKCPLCRKHLSMSDMLDFVDEGAVIHQQLSHYLNDEIISGSKIQKTVEIIEEIHKKGEKVIVFSQWIDTLNLLEKHLQKKQISFMRFEGKLTKSQKQKSLYHFENQTTNADLLQASTLKEDSSQQEQTMGQEEQYDNSNQNQENTSQTPTVLLASLMSGYVGLNLTGANNLILCDSWWNPAVEDQAINRIHRLGQQKQTYIYKMICKDTIEEKIQQINDQKRDIFQTIFNSSEQNKNKKAKEFLQQILN
ncbi:SNF2 family amine-terminal domain protein (macronuclear) [Tetrahymena thermophila SB210]|uniref:SNF2 family amine-terminal domain protein n=1 Tax=Tetrahymena thermophila (strain SB210) TaxID=312017 RepID=I7MD77_TETTS|nr:SNF2 family amine-terminal domain protein [Tetrahymena thermophila SB210]EAR85640.2 SNF2 family amine-terminal domain protein [Tetrahymena thermophila SB210]|eukprot:XP_001033303.2 SNF2 family amine-terminal domain protein [Tetrahymena thermophila SB210]